MLDFSKSFEDNLSFFSNTTKQSYESNIENYKRSTLFEIRETDRLIEYLEDQPKFFLEIKRGHYDQAMDIFSRKLLPAFHRSAKMGKMNIYSLYSIAITMLASTAVECGVPYNISYIQAYIYLMHMAATSSEDEAYYLMFRALFEFLRIIREFQKKQHISDIVTSSLNYIQTHLHHKLTIDDIAKYVNISPRQLTRKFKAEMDQTIIEYINSQRILESKYMLKYSDVALTEIALSIGFSSESYYIDLFKTQVGMTPNVFRKSSGSIDDLIK